MQEFIDKHFFNLFIFTYFFGLIFYNIIGFEYIDEICALILVVAFTFYFFKTEKWIINKGFLFTICVFLFYLIYSLKIHSNSTRAILMDFVIQLKPYLAFFCVYQMRPFLNNKHKLLLNQTAILIWLAFLLPIGILGFINPVYFKNIMGHETSFAGAVTGTSLIFLFSSKYTIQDKFLFVLFLSLGILSGRSKFYGFFILASTVVLYFNSTEKMKLSIRNIFVLSTILIIILIVAKDKIEFYFLQGITASEENTDYIARFVLYTTSLSLFKDYFPFGTGFGSFATYTSGVYYSDIYVKYGIDNIWGLSKSYKSFIADTYYPSLAQFGIIGVILYCGFWIYLIRKTIKLELAGNLKYFTLIIAITGFFFIENIADATFTGNRGFVMMLLLGYIMSNLSYEKQCNEKLPSTISR